MNKKKENVSKEMLDWFKYMKVWFKEKDLLREENKLKLKFLNGMIKNYKEQIGIVEKQIELNKLSYDKGMKDFKREKKKIEKS